MLWWSSCSFISCVFARLLLASDVVVLRGGWRIVTCARRLGIC